MPGIAGIIDFSSDIASNKKTVNRMINILDHTASLIEETCVLNHAAFGVVKLKNYPYHGLIAEDENNASIFRAYTLHLLRVMGKQYARLIEVC